MKKYFLLFAALAVLAGCSKDEVLEKDPSINGTATKTYSMTVDLMAGQNINVGTVSFYDPTDGNGGPLEVTYTITGGWTMSESHVYAGSIDEMPVNNPGAPKIGKFPFKETHSDVTTYTYNIPLGEVDMGNFAIAAHCVVNNNGSETGWASGDTKFRDKGWGTYISNFYAPTNFVPNPLFAIEETNDGSLNLVLIDANSGNNNLIYSENITGANGTISGAGYDQETGYLFFILGNGLYANNLRSDDPTFLMTTINSSSVSGATFNGSSYYYYDNSIDMIVEVLMSYDIDTGLWSYDGELAISPVMSVSNLTITDITSYNNTIYLIGLNSDNPDSPVDLLEFDISSSTFNGPVQTTISSQVDSPTIAAGSNPDILILYAFDISTETGNDYLAIVDPTSGDSEPPQDPEEPPQDPEDPPVKLTK